MGATNPPTPEYVVSCGLHQSCVDKPRPLFGVFTNWADAQRRALFLHGKVHHRLPGAWVPIETDPAAS